MATRFNNMIASSKPVIASCSSKSQKRSSRYLRLLVLIYLCSSLPATNASAPAPVETTELTKYYESIHKLPELGKQETKTAEFIRIKLKEFGYSNLLSIETAPTTVIAVLETGKPGPVVCFRAEMDARKCPEKSGVPFASTIPGIMHNCGHDAHAAILLETAHRLIEKKQSLNGKVVFLFQPAEECAGGADDIVADGILKRLGVDCIFAQHCAPRVLAGKHTMRAGAIMAGASTITIKLSGKGGHAAEPHERDDLAALASLITLEIERLPARNIDAVQYPTICSITTSKWSSEQVNVAPDTITLQGTIRAFYGPDEKLFHDKSLTELVTQLVDGLASAYGAQAHLSVKANVPPTVNDTKLCSTIKPLLEKSGIKLDDQEKAMFSEDFSFYTATIPCVYFGLGIAKDGLGRENVHSSLFTIHEDSLESGVQLFVKLEESISSNPEKFSSKIDTSSQAPGQS